MNAEPQLFYSGIRSRLKHTVLFRGLLFAIFGISLWLVVGAFASMQFLHTWGFGAFLVGGGLMAFGVVPYRQLVDVENNPHRLVIIPGEAVHFFHKGKPLYSIPVQNIAKVEYRDSTALYGVAVWLKQRDNTPIIIYRSRIDPQAYVARVQKRYHCDLFLPYFPRATYTNLEELSTLSKESEESHRNNAAQ